MPAECRRAVAHVNLSGNFTNDIPGELTKIFPTAEKAIQLDPLSSEAYDALGAAYAREGQWEQSEKKLPPRHRDPAWELGSAHRFRKVLPVAARTHG